MSLTTDLPCDPSLSRHLLLEDWKLLLPNDVHQWPAWMQRRGINFGQAVTGMLGACCEAWQQCARCGAKQSYLTKIDRAHLCGKSRRHHFRSNIIPLCTDCHRWSEAAVNFEEVVRLKKEFDETTDLGWILLLHGKWW